MLKDDLKTLGLYDNVKNYGDAMNMIWSDSGAPIRNYMRTKYVLVILPLLM
jgi:hypothetical protein